MKLYLKNVLVTLFFLPCLVFAGGFSNQGDATNLSFKPEEIADFSKKIEKYLAANGAKVALVARKGRPESEMPEGIKYTHVGFWVYSNITLADGKVVPGYVTYNLYQKDDAIDTSHLVKTYPAEFFSNVYALEAGVTLLKPSLEEKILKVIASDTYQKLHIPSYSVTANPFNDKYQNCTEFVLDVLMAALYKTSDYQQIKANSEAYFEPQEVKISTFKRLLGPAFVKDFTTKDQGKKILTATYSTLTKFLQKYNLVREVSTIK